MYFDYIIVGTGISGSLLGHQLSNNFNFIILEKNSKPGGRIETVNGIDFGAQWIGKKHKRMLGLCKKFGIELEKQKYSGKNIVEQYNVPSNPHPSYGLINFLVSHPEYDTFLNGKVSDFFPECKECTSILAKDPKYVSMKFFIQYIRSSGSLEDLCDGPESAQKWKVKGGVIQIINKLLECCRDKIYYNTKVLEVKEVQGGVIVYTNRGVLECGKLIMTCNKIFLREIKGIGTTGTNGKISSGNVIKVFLKTGKVPVGIAGNNFNIFHHNQGLVLLITGLEAVEYMKYDLEQRSRMIMDEVRRIYKGINIEEYYERYWDTCFTCIEEEIEGLDGRNGKGYRGRIGRNIYNVCSETSEEYYGYMEGGCAAVEKFLLNFS